MKPINYIILLALFAACSKGPQTKSGFKILLGGTSSLSSLSGAYIKAFNLKNNTSEIYKLDSSNSTTIPYGQYDLQAIAFQGSEDKSGPILCSSLNNVTLSTEEATFTLDLSLNECEQTKYHNTILSIKDGVNAQWGFDRFSASKWGP